MEGLSSRQRWLLAAILGIGLLLRLTYLLEIVRAPDFDLPQFEAQYHDYWARALLTNDWTPPDGVTDPEIRERPYFRPPGYPYFLAGVYAVTGADYLLARLFQMLLGLASCGLLFFLSRRAFGNTSAFFAVALAAVYWIFIFFEGELMAVGLLIFLLLVVLTLAARWTDGFSVRSAVVTGVVVGLATLVRPNAAVLVPVLLLWAAWLAQRRGNWRTLSRPALALVAAMIVTTAPATLRNWQVADDWVWITSNAGVNLFVGTHPQSDGHRPGVPELGVIAGLDKGWDSFDYPLIARSVAQREGRPMKDSEVSAYFTRRAVDYVAAEPVEALGLAWRKLLLFWGPAEVSNNKVLHFERAASSTLRFSPGFATILALALVGATLFVGSAFGRSGAGAGATAGATLFVDPRRSVEIGVLLLGVIAVYSASFLPFFVSARFRAPLIPLLLVFAGLALDRLWHALQAQQLGRVAAVLALIVTVRVATGVAWVPYEPDEALWHWRRGLLWKAKSELPRAAGEFQQAIIANPTHAEAHLSLAETFAAGGRADDAIAAYRGLLRVEPGSLVGHNNLARLLAGRGELDDAITHWEAALKIDPERVSVLNNLAYALATHPNPERRDPERAIELAEGALARTDDPHSQIYLTLAAALRAAGRDDEAAAAEAKTLRAF